MRTVEQLEEEIQEARVKIRALIREYQPSYMNFDDYPEKLYLTDALERLVKALEERDDYINRVKGQKYEPV